MGIIQKTESAEPSSSNTLLGRSAQIKYCIQLASHQPGPMVSTPKPRLQELKLTLHLIQFLNGSFLNFKSNTKKMTYDF